jgi:hypothetical protein
MILASCAAAAASASGASWSPKVSRSGHAGTTAIVGRPSSCAAEPGRVTTRRPNSPPDQPAPPRPARLFQFGAQSVRTAMAELSVLPPGGRSMGPNVDMLTHRPNSGTRPRRQETAFQRHSGAAGPPPAWSCCGGSPGMRRPVRRDRPPDRQGLVAESRLPPRQAAPPWSSCVLQGGTQAVHLLPVFLGFRMPLLMKPIDPGGHVARIRAA